MLRKCIPLCLFLLVMSCSEELPMEFIYADGSGNTYVLKEDILSYNPVKPEMSSSGIYDGGEPVHYTLSPEEKEALLKAARAALRETSSHIDNRLMGSGQLTLLSANKETTVILSAESTAKNDLEAVLLQLVP